MVATVSQAELDWVKALRQYTRKIKAAPKMRHDRGVLDLIRIDTCCEGILGPLFDTTHRGPGAAVPSIEYVNQVGDVVIPLDDMGQFYSVLSLDE